ncbi:MAG: flagellar motor switch protein FliN [SAR92 clade bacterium]|jgi:flagellar motor switch protein FliN/FliY|uniref:Flagellar motor switch protein FliN n=1 Tax=SAR92 clade bacterium TaxID=2315479 RepID=A0A520MFQ7_9GAMM|nr:MAG: flagellar motor switch protein FliN [SAR92 clade bacterium]
MEDKEVNLVDQADQASDSESLLEETNKSKIDADVLQNIAVTLSLEVGRTSLKIRDIMSLSQGSVVELSKLAGEPLDLLVNNTRVAQGEVVLVGDRYGVKLTNVVPASERVKNL